MPVKITMRKGNAAQWIAVNPILSAGEIGVELDTKRLKIGDGINPWVTLGYATPPPVTNPVRLVTTDYQIQVTDNFIIAQSSAPINLTLPTLPLAEEMNLIIKRAGTGMVTVIGLIDGGTNAVLNGSLGNESISLVSQGGSWYLW